MLCLYLEATVSILQLVWEKPPKPGKGETQIVLVSILQLVWGKPQNLLRRNPNFTNLEPAFIVQNTPFFYLIGIHLQLHHFANATAEEVQKRDMHCFINLQIPQPCLVCSVVEVALSNHKSHCHSEGSSACQVPDLDFHQKDT